MGGDVDEQDVKMEPSENTSQINTPVLWTPCGFRFVQEYQTLSC